MISKAILSCRRGQNAVPVTGWAFGGRISPQRSLFQILPRQFRFQVSILLCKPPVQIGFHAVASERDAGVGHLLDEFLYVIRQKDRFAGFCFGVCPKILGARQLKGRLGQAFGHFVADAGLVEFLGASAVRDFAGVYTIRVQKPVKTTNRAMKEMVRFMTASFFF